MTIPCSGEARDARDAPNSPPRRCDIAVVLKCEEALIFDAQPRPMSTQPAAPRAPVADGLVGRQHVLALAAILLSVAMATLDTAIANTALPTIADSLHVSEAQ